MSGPKIRPNRRSTIEARARALAGAPRARVHVGLPKAAEGDAEDGTPSAAASTAELWLYGVVGGFWWGFDAESVAAALRELPEDIGEVRVRVHSPGGSALEGIAIMNLLANFPAKITVVVDGLAASAASVLILGGDDIVVSPGSQVMIHDCSTITYGNAAALRSDADWIDKQSANYAEVYATRGGTPEARREAMTADNGRGTWYTASEAVAEDVNLADRVGKIESVTPPPPAPSVDDWDDEAEAAAAAAFDRDVLVANADVWAAWTSTPGAMPRPIKPPTASADGNTHTEGTAMSLSDAATKALRAKLGITAEDADEATILAALDEVLGEQAEPTPGGTTAPATPTAAAVKVPEGFKLVDAEGFESMKTDAELGRKAFEAQARKHRDDTIQAAISAGKFAPSRREHFEALWAVDAEGTEETIKALEAGVVPVAEIGHDQTPDGDEPAVNAETAGDFLQLVGMTPEEFAS
jgi:ATP-dependent protease ClpP protease subunit